MFILKPTQPEVFTKDDIETIEEVVRDSRLVDKGIGELKKFTPNAPSFDPERRRFLKHVAVLAALYASGQLLKGCAAIQGPETVYPAGAPVIASDYLDNFGFEKGQRSYKLKRLGPHNGIDIDGPEGYPVLAAADGIVFRSHWSNEAG